MKKVLWVMAGMVFLAGMVVLAQETASAAPELKVEQIVIAKEVKDRAPVEPGDKFSAEVGKLYCFTKISGARGETEIKHVWYLADKVVGEVPLKINGPTWRTWSYKTIDKTMTGAWKAEVQDESGKVLATVNFTIE